MGMINESHLDALFNKTLQNVLALLFRNPNRSYYTNEIILLAKIGSGAAQRELKNLLRTQIITVTELGNQKHYQANPNNPLFKEIRSIILKTFGLADVIREALNPLSKQISIAFIYGSTAKQTDTAKSDIDLMIISNTVSYGDIFSLLGKAEKELGKKINPTLYSESEWIKKAKEHNNFVIQVIKHPKIFLLGTEDELEKFSKDRPVKTRTKR